ncbi:hypothetical protein [Nitriliruptor alkaliphilus]|uniref:hypothetical protein n=1 Tax=Nitriliruptor alkaliphilus TaxID=427918 RepID=UPI0006990928|nr:hypothetical protein [Nitriliruptor alkaliphilus]
MNQIAGRRVRAGVVAGVLAALLLALPGVDAHAQGPGNGQGNAPGNGQGHGPGGPGPGGGDVMPEPDPGTSAAAVPFELVEDRDVDDRLPQPEDRYALAGGCYAIEAPEVGFVARDGAGLTLADEASAVPFHLQATRLGSYLLAANEGPDTSHEDAWWDVRGYVSAVSALPELPLLGTLPAPPAELAALPVDGLSRVAVAAHPSPDADWELAAAGDDPDRKVDVEGGEVNTYVLTLPDRDRSLGVIDGELALVPADDAAPLVFHHVPDDTHGRPCATWPEIDTGADGRPAPTGTAPGSRVEGFFEAHVHGMAFEFLGGELRCGQPWHPYGVEYALGDCTEGGTLLNGVLEVPLAGKGPQEPITDYDPVGWPTFAYWPQHDTLTHEQYYYRWLERAYLGGLRLTTNLLVDNTALCQLYPYKRNSCNEMDGVRLQAQRLYELQDYIDAQSGGPGEGWLRIVTSPAQARETINAGRLAIVLGIEVSVLFDCGEILDQPQCTEDEIDERLQEVVDLGVRQMEIVNKFDNALTGVTGDGGTTGLVVNAGNRYVTGHFWDMQTCPDDHSHDHGDEHDKTQMNVVDETPDGFPEEIDELAARVIELSGATRGYALPLYGPGPHCNTRGLTDLGAHLIRRLVEHGVIFDPDHMSALAQRQALDLIEEIIAEREAADEGAAPGRPGRGQGQGIGKVGGGPDAGGRTHPGLMSSHSWANEVIYQRIYELDGVVAPRTSTASGFADRWVTLREYAARWAPEGYDFGLGYGADTNGLGGQPGPRGGEVAERIDYAQGFAAPIGGVHLGQQVSGVKPYDINTDGVAHYGLFADWFHEVQLAAEERHAERGGGEAILRDMLNASEQYLAMWERAAYGGNDCVVDGSTLQHEDLHALLGLNVEGFLRAIGQPIDRDGDAFVYCAEDEAGDLRVVDVTFDGDGVAVEVDLGAVVEQLPGGAQTLGASSSLDDVVVEAPTGPARASDLHDHVHHGGGVVGAHRAVAAGAASPDESGAGLLSLMLLLAGLVALSTRRMVHASR